MGFRLIIRLGSPVSKWYPLGTVLDSTKSQLTCLSENGINHI